MRLGDLGPDDLRRRLRTGGIRLRTGPFVSELRSPLGRVAAALAFGYADFPVADDAPFADFHVRLGPPWGIRRWLRPQVGFYVDGELAFVPFPRHAAVALLEWGLNWCVSVHAHQFLMIHSAVLERGGRALLLAGGSGSGKSTLCAALALRGWRLLSDEIALVRLEDGLVAPLPRPISLKNESIEVLRRFSAQAEIGPSWENTVKGTVAHMRPPRQSVLRADEAAAPAWVVFVAFRRGERARSSRFAKGAALMRLADHSFNYSLLGVRGFEAMARLIDQCDCHSFSYGELEEAVARFEALPLPRSAEPARPDA